MKFTNKNKRALPHWTIVKLPIGNYPYNKIKRWCQLHNDKSRFYIERQFDGNHYVYTSMSSNMSSNMSSKVIGYTVYFEHAPAATFFVLGFKQGN